MTGTIVLHLIIKNNHQYETMLIKYYDDGDEERYLSGNPKSPIGVQLG